MASSIRSEISARLEDVRLNQAALNELLTGRHGAVMKDLARRAIRVEGAAKRNATRRPGPMVRTGRLRGSITWRLGEDAISPYADVGTNVHYAPFVELGHRIVTEQGEVVGRAPAYPYLRPALQAARLD